MTLYPQFSSALVNIYSVHIKEDISIRTLIRIPTFMHAGLAALQNSLKCILYIPYHSFDITFSGSFESRAAHFMFVRVFDILR